VGRFLFNSIKYTAREAPLVIALVNLKGGCGKSTIAVNLACELASAGDPVLLIDNDDSFTYHLTDGQVEVGPVTVTLTINPVDAQFIQSRGFSQAEMAMIFGVPGHWIGQVDRTPTAVDVESQERMFTTRTMDGYFSRFEEALSDPMMSPRGQYVQFDLDERFRSLPDLHVLRSSLLG